jgi:hypothetical protein
MRGGVLLTGLALAAVLAAPVAQAQRGSDWYRDVRPYLGAAGEEAARRVRLWEEFARLRAGVQRADRRGEINLRDADRFYDRLDRVAHFLRNDRKLTESEYNRRRGDLDRVARDLDRVAGERYSSNAAERDRRR